MRIIFATGNKGKLKEIQLIMEDLGVEVLSMKEAGVDMDIEENGTTFEENAFLRNAFGRKGCLSCRLSDVEYAYIFKLANLLIHQDDEYQKVSLFLYNVITLLMMKNEIGVGENQNDYVVDLVTKLNNYTYLTTKVQDIYGHYPVAKCKLIKEFRDYTGMTIVQYQKKQKLAYATQLLANSDYQITQIAEILGFDSFSHFLRIFKEEYGTTPKVYRKLRQGEK
jgi:AraC-like DNA-binding protein